MTSSVRRGDGVRDVEAGLPRYHDQRPRKRRHVRRAEVLSVLGSCGIPWRGGVLPQCGPTLVKARTTRYALPNSIGNLVDRAVTFGTLVFGGIMDRYPELKICLGPVGGYAPFGVARMDKTWRAADPEVPEFADARLPKPPSEYLNRFFYDSCTYTESTLRFLIDAVGIDRVVLGTDYPAPMVQEDPVGWLEKLDGITDAERTAILETGTHARPVAACPPAVGGVATVAAADAPRGCRERVVQLCARLAGVREAVQLSDRIIILEFGGKTFADIEVGLCYPRLQSDPAVSTMQSEILAVFEEMQSRRASGDPRIAARAEGESSTA